MEDEKEMEEEMEMEEEEWKSEHSTQAHAINTPNQYCSSLAFSSLSLATSALCSRCLSYRRSTRGRLSWLSSS